MSSWRGTRTTSRPTGAPRSAPVGLRTALSKSTHLPSVTTYQVARWAALGDRTRRMIFERLADQPQAVGELARELPVSRPAVSQHLKVLKDAGLVIDRAAGTRRIYQL